MIKYIFKIFSNFRIKIFPNNEIEDYRRKTLNPTFRGVVFTYLTQVLYMNYIHSKNFTYLVAQERFLTNQVVFYLQRGHFLTEKINSKIDMMLQSGLIEQLRSKYVDLVFLQHRKSSEPPSALSLSKLSAIFWLWLFGMTSTMIILFLECLWKYLT